MIVEYIRYQIPEERREAFEAAYARARGPLDASPHCLRYELSHGIEDPDNYVLRIEWDSLEGHEQGFRQSPEFRAFLTDVRPFIDAIQEMRHYQPTGIAG